MKRLYQIFDNEAQLANPTIYCDHNDTVAIRNFKGIFTIEATMPNKHPTHYELRCLGVQDENDGTIQLHNPHITVYTGQMWVDEQERTALINYRREQNKRNHDQQEYQQ